MKQPNTTLGIVTLIVFAIVMTICWPMLVIMSVNTLFGTMIPITLKTWFSVVILGLFIRTNVTIN